MIQIFSLLFASKMKTSAAEKRLQKEWQGIDHNHFQIVVDPRNMFVYSVRFLSIANPRYEGVQIKCLLSFPNDYPFRPPAIFFRPHLLHPNVNSDGRLVLPFIFTDWAPSQTVNTLLQSIWCILEEPVFGFGDGFIAPQISDKGKEEELPECKCVNEDAERLWPDIETYQAFVSL
jgi:ubiquitin-protein ligase